MVQFHQHDGQTTVASGTFTQADFRQRDLILRGRVIKGRKGPIFRVQATLVAAGPDTDLTPAPNGIAALMAEIAPGIGPATAQRVVEELGDGAWRALTREPHLLGPVLGESKAQGAHKAFADLGVERANGLAHLMALGLSKAYAERALDELGVDATEQMRKDPYVLLRVKGVGFATADTIARERLGIEPGDPRRLKALVVSQLETAARDGHTSLARETLLKESNNVLVAEGGVSTGEDALDEAVRAGAIVEEDGECYLPRLYADECLAAERLAMLLTRAPRTIAGLTADSPGLAAYTAEQREAIVRGLTEPVLLITGRPGTGKTTVAREILRHAREMGVHVTLAATTGKAADRLRESLMSDKGPGDQLSGLVPSANTIHSLVHPRRGQVAQLPPGIVMIDEAGMTDLTLLGRILEAAGPDTSLVFLGDPEQLPPVMAGHSARDLRDSGLVPTVVLQRVHRQGAHSLIAINADRILEGKAPIFYRKEGVQDDLRREGMDEASIANVNANCYRRHATTPLDGARKIVDTVRRLKASGYEADDIQVFIPMKRGYLGTHNVNRMLQAALNPGGAPLRSVAEWTFRIAPPHDASLRGDAPSVGDVVEMFTPDSRAAARKGTRGQVMAIEPQGALVVRWAPGTPDEEEARYGSLEYDRLRVVKSLELRVGDPVLHGENDRQRDLRNGMRGVVESALPEGGAVIRFGDRREQYTARQLRDLLVAYATTVHKGQGQEAPVAIYAAHHGEHQTMLDTALLRVALTRATERWVYVGSNEALHISLKRSRGPARRTRLPKRTARVLAELEASGVVLPEPVRARLARILGPAFPGAMPHQKRAREPEQPEPSKAHPTCSWPVLAR